MYSTHSPNAYKTHNTEACKKLDVDTTAKPFNGRNTGNSNGACKRLWFAVTRKESKRGKKKMKKLQKMLGYTKKMVRREDDIAPPVVIWIPQIVSRLMNTRLNLLVLN